MKKQLPVKNKYHFTIAIFMVLSILFSSCQEKIQIWKPASQEQPAGDYIESNPEQFSEFAILINSTKLGAILKLRGPYTVFLPTNEAMAEYYKMKGVNSCLDFSDSFREELVRNHLIPDEIPTGDIGLGAIRVPNTIGDYLVTEFEGSEIIVNKYSKIIKRDIRTANGYIHVINKAIDPLTKDMFTVISENPSFSIFAESLRLTGLNDTLQQISFPYGESIARTRFTLLVVPDSVFKRNGINTVNDLIAWCGASSDDLTSLNNPFYRFIEYHCLNNTYYLSDLNTGIYPILSRDNNIEMTVDNDYKLNLDRKTNKYTGFNIPASNIPSKNGAIHVINDLLPVIEPEPASVIFETTDFFDLKHGDWYLNYYMKWGDGENTFAKIKWVGDYLEYYYKPVQDGISDHDCLSMVGWWSISITFPKVMKGRYSISIFQPSWSDVTNCQAYVDGVMTSYTYTGPRGGGTGGLQKIAEVDFPTTSEHTITLRNIVYGGIWWDYIRFDPLK